MIEETNKHAEFEDRLFKKYPEIFQDRTKPMTQTCMCWGIETGVGWEKLLDELCAELTLIRKVSGIKLVASQVKEKYSTLRFYLTNEDHCPGRLPECASRRMRLRHALAWEIYKLKSTIGQKWYELKSWLCPGLVAVQRARNDVWNDIIDACVDDAERKSAQTCEVCGEYGKMNNGNWLMVRCAKHWEGPGTYDEPGDLENEDEEQNKQEKLDA